MRPTRKWILDLGCGKKKRPDAVGVDVNPLTNPDVLFDLDEFPYPIRDACIDEIYLDNAMEHLADVIRVMEELHRILKPGGLVKIIVPYFRSHWAYIDPTHRHFFTVNSFAYFDPQNPICVQYNYTRARFSVERVVFNETQNKRLMTRLLERVANRWPTRYEYYLSHIYPLDDLSFYLRKV